MRHCYAQASLATSRETFNSILSHVFGMTVYVQLYIYPDGQSSERRNGKKGGKDGREEDWKGKKNRASNLGACKERE